MTEDLGSAQDHELVAASSQRGTEKVWVGDRLEGSRWMSEEEDVPGEEAEAS
jgi:hypothetical protein